MILLSFLYDNSVEIAKYSNNSIRAALDHSMTMQSNGFSRAYRLSITSSRTHIRLNRKLECQTNEI